MTRDEAVEVFFRFVSPKSKRAVERLMAWDSGKTLRENATGQGMSLENAASYAYRYRLQYVKKWTKKACPAAADKREAVDILRRSGWSLNRIGGVFKVSRQRIEQMRSV